MKLTGIGRQQILPSHLARSAVFLRLDVYADTISPFQDLPRYSLAQQVGRRRVLSHLVDGQDSVNDHVRLGVGKLGEDETGAVAQGDLVRQVECLEMLGLSRGRRD